MPFPTTSCIDNVKTQWKWKYFFWNYFLLHAFNFQPTSKLWADKFVYGQLKINPNLFHCRRKICREPLIFISCWDLDPHLKRSSRWNVTTKINRLLFHSQLVRVDQLWIPHNWLWGQVHLLFPEPLWRSLQLSRKLTLGTEYFWWWCLVTAAFGVCKLARNHLSICLTT